MAWGRLKACLDPANCGRRGTSRRSCRHGLRSPAGTRPYVGRPQYFSPGQVAERMGVGAGRQLRILVLSWSYPTTAAPQEALWVERMCDAAAEAADVRVIVPTPWVPPLVSVRSAGRFRGIPSAERRGSVEIW